MTVHTNYQRVERNRFFVDRDGEQSVAQHDDEAETYAFDYTNALSTNETVTASSWDSSGVTTSGAALTTPVASIKVSGTDGWIENTATITDSGTSATRTVVRRLNFYNRVK